jgi:hypothetical protein
VNVPDHHLPHRRARPFVYGKSFSGDHERKRVELEPQPWGERCCETTGIKAVNNFLNSFVNADPDRVNLLRLAVCVLMRLAVCVSLDVMKYMLQKKKNNHTKG